MEADPELSSSELEDSLSEESLGGPRKITHSKNINEFEDVFDPNEIIDRLPQHEEGLQNLLEQVKEKMRFYKEKFMKEEQANTEQKSYVGENSVPICADVTKFNFEQLVESQKRVANREFDVIMMDPPWRLATSTPSRGVAIQYDSLADEVIQGLPI